jgi:hypothetical protein
MISTAVLALLLFLVGVPALGVWLTFGSQHSGTATRRRIRVGAGTTLLLVWGGLLATHAIQVRPWQSGILARGMSPDGREYCVVQTFQGFFEPYRVSLYVRDATGIWHWHYLAHQDHAWRSISVGFTADEIVVARDGVERRRFPRKIAPVDLTTVLPGYAMHYRSANLTADEVAEFHHRWARGAW